MLKYLETVPDVLGYGLDVQLQLRKEREGHLKGNQLLLLHVFSLGFLFSKPVSALVVT